MTTIANDPSGTVAVHRPLLAGKRISLRPIQTADVTEAYCRWMNDQEVTQYLECRFVQHTRASLEDYVTQITRNPDYLFLAIILKAGDRHIGNIKLGPINWAHRTADLGFLIGEKSAWGQGYATEAIRLVTEYAFRELGLHKVTAGCYATNIGSAKALRKAQFIQEGLRPQQYACNGPYVDEVLFGLVRPEDTS